MKTIIAGSRDLVNPVLVQQAIEWTMLHVPGFKITEVICGEAEGPDNNGKDWALANDIPVNSMPAKWKVNGQYRRNAGMMRNIDMANVGEALIDIWDGASSGSQQMITTAKKKGLLVVVAKVGSDGVIESFELTKPKASLFPLSETFIGKRK